MEKIYNLDGYEILIIYENKLIRIESAEKLKKYLSKDINFRSENLAKLIKNDYLIFYNKELRISNNSIIIEIWGHILAGYIARSIKKLINLKLVIKPTNFIITRSDKIDCGERTIDSNRLFWDIIAIFKWFVFLLLPKNN